LHRRHGDNPAEYRNMLERLSSVRSRVLDNAGIAAGEKVLDVGCGDGLIAFGALERVGSGGTVIFSDISADLLAHDRRLASDLGVADRCRFVEASASDLRALPSSSVDVVTTRSVLAYVKDKRAAFNEFARVLRPGGRVSLYEPVNRLISDEPDDRFFGYDVGAVRELARRLNDAYAVRQPAEDDPMFDYDERDLLRFAAEAGFGERHLELHYDIMPHDPRDWNVFVSTSPNPLAPTLAEAMEETLSPEEQTAFTAHLRPLVERGSGTFAVATAYLWGVKGEKRERVQTAGTLPLDQYARATTTRR
jgi:SAM-dependent methyltransferase